jgi:hypothetical protein
MKTVINVIISRLDSDKEGSTELEDTIETSQSEEQCSETMGQSQNLQRKYNENIG